MGQEYNEKVIRVYTSSILHCPRVVLVQQLLVAVHTTSIQVPFTPVLSKYLQSKNKYLRFSDFLLGEFSALGDKKIWKILEIFFVKV
jgi:hypothetical protein